MIIPNGNSYLLEVENNIIPMRNRMLETNKYVDRLPNPELVLISQKLDENFNFRWKLLKKRF